MYILSLLRVCTLNRLLYNCLHSDYYTVVTDPVGNLATNGPERLGQCHFDVPAWWMVIRRTSTDLKRTYSGSWLGCFFFFFGNAFYCHNRLHFYGVEMSEEENWHGAQHLSQASFVSFFSFRSDSNDTVMCRSCLRALEAARRFGMVIFFAAVGAWLGECVFRWEWTGWIYSAKESSLNPRHGVDGQRALRSGQTLANGGSESFWPASLGWTHKDSWENRNVWTKKRSRDARELLQFLHNAREDFANLKTNYKPSPFIGLLCSASKEKVTSLDQNST